jgi:amino acid adenylation domain-containing protein
MPCQPRKARLLLKDGRAKVVEMVPFTIQLLSGSSGYKQEISLGVDAGTQHIGVSATTEKVVLFEAEVKPRTDIQELLATRRQFRRARRSRKTRYRQARFQNRKKHSGWLAPSVQHKVDCHLKTIRMIHKIVPISTITIEVAQFDIQKIQKPDIQGKEYQEGPQLDFWNTREYVLFRDNHCCQWCKGKSKDPLLHVHHIVSRKRGGDRPDNLITLCETCHDLIHRTHQEHQIEGKSNGFRDATQMGIIRWYISHQVKESFPTRYLTYGYLTKHTRIEHALRKSHVIDARCMSGHPFATSDNTWYLLKMVRRNNRQLHKATVRRGGKRQRNTAPKYVHGFRLFDCVRYQGQTCFVFGRRSTGYFDLRTLNGTKIHASARSKKLTIVQKSHACLVERNAAMTMKSLARHFASFSTRKRHPLDSQVPHTRPPLSEVERRRLLVEWNDTHAAYPEEACIHQLFEAQVARTPQAVALVCGPEYLTYHQLNERANRLAHYLQRLGLGPDLLAGICLQRSPQMIIAVLAVLKAGGAYVPLDPVYPSERLAFMLQDCRAAILLTGERESGVGEQSITRLCLDADADRQQIAQCAATNPASQVQSSHLAYVIYTSGSTGTPKGVAIAHRSLVNHACAFGRYLQVRPGDRMLQFASLSFDTAAEEIFPTLISGATLLLRPELSDPLAFLRFVAEEQITVLNLPTAYWSTLSTHLAECTLPPPPALRSILVGGERAPRKSLRLWQHWAGEQITWINGYGPTETTITATLYTAPPDAGAESGESVPIGRPIANAQLYVLDDRQQPTPIGTPGELYIAGACLARGYLFRPALTRERFLPCPFSTEAGARMYKTGDLVRYRANGQLEFLGRIDQQIKIRGFRIEPGEIEAALGLHPEVQTCVVTARTTREQPELVAYIVARTPPGPGLGAVREFLSQRLPAYMLPAALLCLPTFPLTPNGKVDYQALPAPQQRATGPQRVVIPPATPVEKRLADLAAPLLGLEAGRPGRDENFFLIGGDSLMGIQLSAHIARAFGIELPLRTLLARPTVRLLAETIEQSLLSQIAEMDEQEARSLLEKVSGRV